jgi:molecular chaperone DnaK
VKDGDDLEAITAKRDALSQASLKIGQAIYGSGSASAPGDEEEKKKDDDDKSTVDADFTEKKDDGKKDK